MIPDLKHLNIIIMKTIKLIITALLLAGLSYSQSIIVLTFNGDNNGEPVSMDSIRVKNLDKGIDTVLFYPENILVLGQTGINNTFSDNSNFSLKQNFPNPMDAGTKISLETPGEAELFISVSDMMGRAVATYTAIPDRGQHTFTFISGNERFYFLNASCSGISSTIKIYNPQPDNCHPQLIYEGCCSNMISLKASNGGFLEQYEAGDDLMVIGHNSLGQSGFHDDPEASHEYVVQFATNIPCPGAETVVYEGQTYNTIQIFGQCWFKENLNVGTRIHQSVPQTNNDTIEKYCFMNQDTYCDMLGGLYKWDELMNYSSASGNQGICPPTGGWHVPDDIDWQILEGAVDSEYGIGDPVWTSTDWRGNDSGGNLKQTGTSLWEPPNTGATDAFGFTALPAGYFVDNAFWGAGYKTYFWSSDHPAPFIRNIDWDKQQIKRMPAGTEAAVSARCVKSIQ